MSYPPPDSTAKFVLHKYSAIFLPLLFSAISGFLIYECLIYGNTADVSVTRIPLLLFEIFPTQIAGFFGFWATGVSWYLAAMLMAIAMVHPFAKKDPLKFGYTAAPVISILVYGLLCHQFNALDVPNSWVLEIVNTGLLRGLAGICAGCVLFCLVKRSETKVSLGMQCVFTAAELVGFWYLLSTISDAEKARTNIDFVLTAVLFGILYLALSGKTLFSRIPANPVSRVMATVSTYIFLNHYPWCVYFSQTYFDTNLRTREEMFWPFLGCVATSALATWTLTVVTRRLLKQIKKIRLSKLSEKEALS